MARGKTNTWIVIPAANTGTRLIKGTLREVEQKLRGEVEIRPATVDDGRALADLEVESAEEE
jgi:hypothetical protein